MSQDARHIQSVPKAELYDWILKEREYRVEACRKAADQWQDTRQMPYGKQTPEEWTALLREHKALRTEIRECVAHGRNEHTYLIAAIEVRLGRMERAAKDSRPVAELSRHEQVRSHPYGGYSELQRNAVASELRELHSIFRQMNQRLEALRMEKPAPPQTVNMPQQAQELKQKQQM